MGGFFGTIKKEKCVADLFYGVDYNSHMGTKRAGMVTQNNGTFTRAIHNIENSYFRSKFEDDLPSFSGNSGIGVISDTDAQPIIINSHLGKFAIVSMEKPVAFLLKPSLKLIISLNSKKTCWPKVITFANIAIASPISLSWYQC